MAKQKQSAGKGKDRKRKKKDSSAADPASELTDEEIAEIAGGLTATNFARSTTVPWNTAGVTNTLDSFNTAETEFNTATDKLRR